MILSWLDLRTDFEGDTPVISASVWNPVHPKTVKLGLLLLTPCGSLLGSTPIALHPFHFSYSVYPVARILSRSDMIVHPSPEGLSK